MKKMMKKMTVTALAGVGMLTLAGVGLSMQTANADVTTPPTIALSIEDKASIKTSGQMGIAFQANVENAADIVAYYGADNVEFGMLLAPADYLSSSTPLEFDGGLTEWTEGGSAENTYRKGTVTPDEDGNMICRFVNINTSNYSRPFAARAYVGIKEGDTVSYTYSSVTERAVYTVASHAVVKGGYEGDVATYLNGVVSAVQEHYTTLDVSLGATTFDGTNNTITPTATVSNGTKTLETGVALTADNIEKTSAGYEVTTLGDFSATAAIGGLSKTVEGLSCTMVCADNDDVHITKANASATATLTKVDAKGRTDVMQWATEADSCAANNSMLNFDGPFTKTNIEGGNTYLIFDFWTNAKVQLTWYGHKNADNTSESTVYLYRTAYAEYLNEEGYTIDSNGLDQDTQALNRWITVQAQIPDGTYHTNNQWAGLGFISLFSSSCEIYVDNFRLATAPTTSLGVEPYSMTILADEADLTAGNMYVYNEEKAALDYDADGIGGRSGVFKWSTSETSALSGTDSTLRITSTPELAATMKKDRYVSLDFYTDTVLSVYWKSSSYLLYNSPNTSYPKVRVFDAEGFEITSGTIWSGALLNQWITFEVQLDTDFAFNGIALGMWSSGFTSSANVYIDNVKVSSTAMTSPTSATILADEDDLTAGNMYANNTSVTTLAYDSTGIGGRSGVFKWSTDSETAVNQTNAMLRFKKTNAAQNLLVTGNYLSFDFYATAPVTLSWGNETSSTMLYLYNSVATTTDVKFYDADGELLTSGSIWNGNFNGQWITIEIYLSGTRIDEYLFTSAYRGIGVYGNGFTNANPLYIDNVKVSTTSMSATGETE